MTVMLVEDDNDIRELVQQFLEMEGYAVNAFSRGREALDALVEGPLPRVILLDWRMPSMTGKQFLEEYHRMETQNSAPVYLFSAESDARLFENTGASGVLKKPIDYDALLSLLSSLDVNTQPN